MSSKLRYLDTLADRCRLWPEEFKPTMREMYKVARTSLEKIKALELELKDLRQMKIIEQEEVRAFGIRFGSHISRSFVTATPAPVKVVPPWKHLKNMILEGKVGTAEWERWTRWKRLHTLEDVKAYIAEKETQYGKPQVESD